MALYKENENKLKLNVSDTRNDVFVKLDCYHGTMGWVTFYYKGVQRTDCGGEPATVGEASFLKGKSRIFTLSMNNPGGTPVKAKLTWFEQGSESLEYAFPDDYTGSPEFDKQDEHPTLKVRVEFK